MRQGGKEGEQESKKRETETGRERSSKCWPSMGRAKMSGQISEEQSVCNEVNLYR